MNRLNKILLSFVLPFFCLLISVSYAEFDLGTQYTCTQINDKKVSTEVIPGYTTARIYNIGYQYLKKGTASYEETYKQLLQDIVNAGYDYVTLSGGYIFILKNADFGLNSNGYYYVTNKNEGDYIVYYPANENNYAYYYTGTIPYYRNISSITIVDSTISVKKLRDHGSGVTSWDGEYYYEAPTEPGEETPTMPTNAEIASAVQAFYNTIYNQPNIAFDDFIVLYDNSTGLYSYIGHTRGNVIGQVIVEPNGYYNGYKFDVQWWQFYLDEENDSWDWTNITKYNNYFLYTSQGDIDTLKYVGKDTIDNLISGGPWATSNTIIVYATNDYPVKYITFSEESPDPVVETGTIKGDQYTYDENLDITDNNYNPLDNFITVNPAITIIGNVDFDEVNKIFEENKNILIIENASWLFTANNQLFNYFSGFILFLIVLIIISRLLGG